MEGSDERNALEKTAHIARRLGAPDRMLRALTECKERADGSGTPNHLRGSQISSEGQLLGLACEFERVYREQWEHFESSGEPFAPVMVMLKRNRDRFAPDVLKALLLAGGFYQVGAIVELNSGALARVVSQNRGAPLRPLVEIVLDRHGNHPERRQMLDLREHPALSIVRTVTRGG
ncbi:hypothetical protein L21SP4_01348 [Kiritimatiella glycovorans]|uniref:Uncharacterized protein n=1 Tax=Kiritimatiella glycovorans TaxID=1307763 RepID=A0A0G3EDR9_9BACT|nr:HD domain-containing phosphohydrolase [Kiritimatiella glycovorans]AKJ64596.1 hypothetical protein L21SP4_01348 [Kiritimatiella glycovorans]